MGPVPESCHERFGHANAAADDDHSDDGDDPFESVVEHEPATWLNGEGRIEVTLTLTVPLGRTVT